MKKKNYKDKIEEWAFDSNELENKWSLTEEAIEEIKESIEEISKQFDLTPKLKVMPTESDEEWKPVNYNNKKAISINHFLINKGFTSNEEKVTILEMIELVNEWEEKYAK